MGLREPPPDVRPWYRVLFGWVGLREVPWAGFAWLLLVAALYSALLLVASPREFWDWSSTFVATFLSVLAAVFLYRHQANRAEHERMYQMYLALDADLEVILTWIDPGRRDLKTLSITLPSGRVAEAVVVMGAEDRAPMLEEVAKSGFETWAGALRHFTLAASLRGHAAACARYVKLYDEAAVGDDSGPSAEQAILQAAENAERLREGLIEECGKMREALAAWFERYPGFSPWGPEDAHRRTPEARGGLFPPPAEHRGEDRPEQ